MTADDLVTALRGLYPVARGWILLPQVRDATGWQGNRTADALAFNAWPSRGLELHGFEVKVSRSDWLRELKQPEKAESVWRFCDRWWVVTPPSDVIRAAELPPTWGHITVANLAKAVIEVGAPQLQPKPVDRVFVAAVLRALQASETTEGKIAAAVKAARAEAFEEGRRHERRCATHDTVRWQKDRLLDLERSAVDALKAIRRELASVKTLDDVPPAQDEDDAAAVS